MLSAILAYMAIYTLGQAFVPPYTMDLSRLVTLATMGVGCFVLQYAVELISYYFTYGKAYRDTADKRIAYIQKTAPAALGLFLKQGVPAHSSALFRATLPMWSTPSATGCPIHWVLACCS